MKNYKKIRFLLCLLAFFGLFSLFAPIKAEAANHLPYNERQFNDATFKFGSDRSTIIATYPTQDLYVPGGEATFIDEDPTDDTYRYSLRYEGDLPDCNAELIFGKHGATDISWGNPNKGISNATVAADIDYGTRIYGDPSAGDTPGVNRIDCKNIGKEGEKKLRTVNNAGILATYFKWSGNTLVPVPPVDVSGRFIPFSNDKPDVFKHETNAKCADIIVLKSGTSATYYMLEKSGDAPPVNSNDFTDLKGLFSKTCFVNKVNFSDNGNFFELAKKSFAISGVRDSTAPITIGAGATEGTPSSCEEGSDNSWYEFNWVFCPVLRGMDAMFTGLNGIVEDQLNICTGTSSTLPNKVDRHCDPKDSLLTNEVKQTWSIFRVLATSLLVILMLVMVFSQAINAGIFDNYTIKKLLPRLVVAAIVIQLSWYVFKFMIDLSNDAGQGVASLMFIPFGGEGKMAFDNLIGNVGGSAAGLTSVGLFTAIVVAGLFSAITIGGVLLLAVSAIAGLLVGVLVLLFREILIILLMIMVPIALIAWVLPGTQRYWKLWQDNFTKLLLMFPLIMAMIAAGRIFAYVGGTTDGTDGFAKILGLLIVFVGFFGPYYMLPKTFNWGGQMFGALANSAINGTKKYRNAPGKYALDSAKANRESRAHLRNARLSDDQSAHPRWDRFLSGGYNYTLSRHARENRFEANRAQGRKTAEESAVQAIVGSEYEAYDHARKLEVLMAVAQGQRHEESGIDGTNNPTLQTWAMDELAKYGDWDKISNLRDGKHVTEPVWQRFVAKNISAIHQNAPHLSPQRTDLSELGYEDVGNWKDFEVAEALRQAEGGFKRDINTGGEARLEGEDLAAQQARWVAFARNALGDYQVTRRLTTAGRRDLEKIANLDLSRKIVDPDGNERQVEITKVSEFESKGQNQPPAIVLPNKLGSEETRRQMTDSLSEADSSGKPTPKAGGMTIAVAKRAVDAAPGSQDEADFVQYLNELRAQAPNSPKARVVHNRLVDAFHELLEKEVDSAERDNLVAGNSAADIDAGVTLQIQHGVDKMSRLGISRI